jgi:hypothetical protein
MRSLEKLFQDCGFTGAGTSFDPPKTIVLASQSSIAPSVVCRCLE